MGTSHPESRPWAIKKILSVKPRFILDVGAGSGTYADALHASSYNGAIDAVEVWGNSIQKYHLKRKYRVVYNDDIRNFKNFDYDVVIFGDVLEHMSKEDAVAVWQKTAAQADYALIAIPIVDYHQGEIDGNPYEEHVKDDWTHEEVLDTFSNITASWTGDVVGAYWAKF